MVGTVLVKIHGHSRHNFCASHFIYSPPQLTHFHWIFFSSSTIQLSFPKYNITGLCPRFRISVSVASFMSTQAPQKASIAPTSFLDSPKPQFGKKNEETRKMKLWDRLSCRATWLSKSAKIEAAESGGSVDSNFLGLMDLWLPFCFPLLYGFVTFKLIYFFIIYYYFFFTVRFDVYCW